VAVDRAAIHEALATILLLVLLTRGVVSMTGEETASQPDSEGASATGKVRP
jgi:hypothetical protein